MKKLIIFVFSISPIISFGQLSKTLLIKVRQSTDEYYIARDTLSITGSKTLPCLDVMINGKGPFRFLIDLGANVLNFKQSVVEETGMDILVDRSRGDIVKADKLQIGNSFFLNVYGASYQELDVDGVIGFNLLKKGNFLMDYPNMKFAFIPDPAELLDSTYVKYETLGRMPYLKSKIGAKDVYINFDTGASGWLYFPIHFKDSVKLTTPLKKGTEMWNNQTGTVQTYFGKINENVSLGNFVIKSPHVIFDPDIDDVFVGSSLLSDFKLIFYPAQELLKMDRAEDDNIIVIPPKGKQ